MSCFDNRMCEKSLESITKQKLNLSQYYKMAAKKANIILDCINVYTVLVLA